MASDDNSDDDSRMGVGGAATFNPTVAFYATGLAIRFLLNLANSTATLWQFMHYHVGETVGIISSDDEFVAEKKKIEESTNFRTLGLFYLRQDKAKRRGHLQYSYIHDFSRRIFTHGKFKERSHNARRTAKQGRKNTTYYLEPTIVINKIFEVA
ncbi:hypothetical protein PHJA_001058800 [Phtheirospermum japonicum]|uniref:Uncharacterized protein n=1 Tax=Phtheirospermum japonicum TaxID=374723 RepID=A0A830C4D8_9LAMI|nr:hypothetical protein PHJA_001058800 [Phtheirospermum japonicum]